MARMKAHFATHSAAQRQKFRLHIQTALARLSRPTLNGWGTPERAIGAFRREYEHMPLKAFQGGLFAIEGNYHVPSSKKERGYYKTPYLLAALAHYSSYPVPSHVVEAKGEAWSQIGNLVANGPFIPVEWVPGSTIRSVTWMRPEIALFDRPSAMSSSTSRSRGVSSASGSAGSGAASSSSTSPGSTTVSPAHIRSSAETSAPTSATRSLSR